MYVIREHLLRLGEDSDITDEAGQPVLHVDGKVLSLHNRLILRDQVGREVGQVHRKLAALRPTYEITIDGKDVAEVRRHLLAPFGERFTIDVHGTGGHAIWWTVEAASDQDALALLPYYVAERTTITRVNEVQIP